MSEIIVIAHNIRSAHNIGALFRTCDGFGVKKMILSGYTPYPHTPSDTRLPHIAQKLHDQIHKTALGAESTVPFRYEEYPNIQSLRDDGYHIIGLEQMPHSVPLPNYRAPEKLALLLGEEVHGIPPELQTSCDTFIEIPMHGAKESFNVSVAAGVALYHLTYFSAK